MIVSGHFSLPATLKYTIEVSGTATEKPTSQIAKKNPTVQSRILMVR